ncbi:MAG: hypothetical protein FWF84_00465, partial [Kiritimatiellaeota bacterium]|nr:hypothetical protein [Kiritimatiellota bacterium]
PAPVTGSPWCDFTPYDQVSYNDLGTVYRGQTVNIPLGGAEANGARLLYVAPLYGGALYGPDAIPFNLHVDPETGELFGQVAFDEALGDYYFTVTLYVDNGAFNPMATFKLTVADEPTGNIMITAIRVLFGTPFPDNATLADLVEIEAEGCTRPSKAYAVFGHDTEISRKLGAGSQNSEIPGTRQNGTGDATGHRLFVFPMPCDDATGEPYDHHFFHVRELE